MTGLDAARALGLAIESEMVASLTSRQELADGIGVRAEAVGGYLRGEREPSLAKLRQIADVLDVTPQLLLDRADAIAGRASRRDTIVATQTAGDGSANIAGATVYGDVVVQAPKDDDDE